MRDLTVSIGSLLAAVSVLMTAAPVVARTACKDDVTAPCVELAGHVGRYDQLVWSVCGADSATVCKCWNAQQRDYGIDWCQWANCACGALTDPTLKQGICGLSTACGSIAAIKQQRQTMVSHSAPAHVAAEVEQVRDGHVIKCSPETCMAVGTACARAAGALEILKDQGKMTDAGACSQLAKDPAAFAKQVHVEDLSPAAAACACGAVF